MSERLQHVVISASAGSGKTYQLVRRYVLLLAWGVEPEKIAAMTFTKKASGEFFNRILNRLADLAEGTLSADSFFEGLTPLPEQWPDFKLLLRRTTEAMQRLRLGTMDSFFANMTACFPLELGLPFGASVMAEEEAKAVKSDVLGTLIERVFREQDEASLGTLLEGFKQATYGGEEKRADEAFMGWVDDGHDLWLERPELERWGGPEVIWPPGQGARLPDLSVAKAVDRVRRAVDPAAKFTAAQAEKWEGWLREIEGMTPGMELPKGAETILKKCEEVWTDLKAGDAEMTFQKKYVFRGEEAEALVALCRCMVGREMLVRCQRAGGVARMLEAYEKAYGAEVREAGRLTFSDVTRLVGRSAVRWLQDSEGADLWYRLDGRYEHWLFDEFQDTSFQQWRVVGGLVEEVMQSSRGERSFFAVGDPKQSIYLWRQAEPRLFRTVAERRDSAGKKLMKEAQLLTSFRSGPAVLEAVNRVCVSNDALKVLLPGATQLWECGPHVANKDMPGCARLLWPVKRGDQEEMPNPEDVTVELLRTLRPLERGLSCAVLVRQNTKGRAMAERIRRETGMEVVCESVQEPAMDNPVTLAVLALLQLAAHPGDGRALEHLRMTPLWPEIENEERNRFATGRDILRRVQAEGFASVVHDWIAKARTVLGGGWDAFAELRGKRLGDLAADFDDTGSRSVDAFLAFAKDCRLRVRGGRQAVQVMTIHASKGLEFDIVILPELSGSAMDLVRSRDIVAKRDAEGILQWVVMEPKREIARLDEVMAAELAEAEARQEFESLCRLYVAMTRAKRGLYLITTPPPKSGESVNEARLLRERLGTGSLEEELGALTVNVAWSTGDPLWHETVPRIKQVATVVKTVRPLGELLRSRQPMVPRVTPSGEEDFRVNGSLLFSIGRDRGRVLGNLVHEMLSQIGWELQADWSAFSAREGYEDALALITKALKSREISALFREPTGAVNLWRERSFDILLPSQGWISGTFDRVVVEPEKGRATIIDFKTDDLGVDEERLPERMKGYQPQLAIYREAVQRLTGAKEVRCLLVFLRAGRVVEVE